MSECQAGCKTKSGLTNLEKNNHSSLHSSFFKIYFVKTLFEAQKINRNELDAVDAITIKNVFSTNCALHKNIS